MVMKSLHRMAAKSLWFVLSFAAVSAFAVDLPANYTRLDWIESTNDGKQYINTGYSPVTGTCIRASFNLGERSTKWASLFGVFEKNDNSSYGVLLRHRDNWQSLNGVFLNSSWGDATVACPAGEDYIVELKSGQVTIGSTVKSITSLDENLANYTAPIYIFCECNRKNDLTFEARRHQAYRLYSMTIVEIDPDTESETVKRNFIPCRTDGGANGLWDAVEGVFYGNQASGADFLGGGFSYRTDANGVVTIVEGGVLPAAVASGASALVVDCAGSNVDSSGVAQLPQTTIRAGGLSFLNNAREDHALTGSLTLYGGASLDFDVSAAGCDALSATSLILDESVSSESPVEIVVNAVGITELTDSFVLVACGSLQSDDVSRFSLTTSVPAGLEVRNGNLVLVSKGVTSSVWTGGASNGKWSEEGNWLEGIVPESGSQVKFNTASGGETEMDIAGISVGSITVGENAGAFVHTGGALGVTGSISSSSSAPQKFTMPISVGVASGDPVTVSAAGDMEFQGGVTVNSGELDVALSAGRTAEFSGLDGGAKLVVGTAGEPGCTVVLSGRGRTASLNGVDIRGYESSLCVTGGISVTTAADKNTGNVNIGNEANRLQTLVVEDASLSIVPAPTRGVTTAAINLGTALYGVGLLDVRKGGVVNANLVGAKESFTRTAIYVADGGSVTNYCGDQNNLFISNAGYGYLENAGNFAMKGWAIVGDGNASWKQSQHNIGIAYQKGGELSFTGEWNGTFDICRGTTGLVYQTGGVINVPGGGIDMNGRYGAACGLGIFTIDGREAVAKVSSLRPVNHNETTCNMTSIVNIREGGTLEYGEIKCRLNTWDANWDATKQVCYMNFAGGFLKPKNSGGLFNEENNGKHLPNAVYAFAGGMGVDVPENVSSTLNFPVSKPVGRGIASVIPPADLLAEEYLGAPFVDIIGDGQGATAVALFDSSTRRVTGIKVISPGCGYTYATASIYQGILARNGSYTATVELTPEGEDQVCGGLVKRGAGSLAIGTGMIPEGMPISILSGTLDLGGATCNATSVTLGGGVMDNGSIRAAHLNVVSPETSVEIRNATLSFAEGTAISVSSEFDLTSNTKWVVATVGEGGNIVMPTSGLSAPKGWKVALENGKLVLCPNKGLLILVR